MGGSSPQALFCHLRPPCFNTKKGGRRGERTRERQRQRQRQQQQQQQKKKKKKL